MCPAMMQTPLRLNRLIEHANALVPSRAVVSRRPDRLDFQDVGPNEGNVKEIA